MHFLERTILIRDVANYNIFNIKQKADSVQKSQTLHWFRASLPLSEQLQDARFAFSSSNTKNIPVLNTPLCIASQHRRLMENQPCDSRLLRLRLGNIASSSSVSFHAWNLNVFPLLFWLAPESSGSAVCCLRVALGLVCVGVVSHFDGVEGVVDGSAVGPAPGSWRGVVQHPSDGLHWETIWETVTRRQGRGSTPEVNQWWWSLGKTGGTYWTPGGAPVLPGWWTSPSRASRWERCAAAARLRRYPARRTGWFYWWSWWRENHPAAQEKLFSSQSVEDSHFSLVALLQKWYCNDITSRSVPCTQVRR